MSHEARARLRASARAGAGGERLADPFAPGSSAATTARLRASCRNPALPNGMRNVTVAAIFVFPPTIGKMIYTTNLLERLFLEARRRL